MIEYFSGSYSSLRKYWEKKFRSEQFKSLGTREPAVEFTLEKIRKVLRPHHLWIDIGTGPGSVYGKARDMGIASHFLGLDFSKAMLQRFDDPQILKVLGDGRYYPLRNNCAELGTSFFVWSDYSDLTPVVQMFYSIVKSSGHVILIDYARGDSYWELRRMLHGFRGIVGNIHLRTPQEARHVFEKIGFEIEYADYVGYEVPMTAMPNLVSATDLPIIQEQRPEAYASLTELRSRRVHTRRHYLVIANKP